MMRVSVAITTDEGGAVVEASGKYAPDVMHDLANRARAALREAWGLQCGDVAEAAES